MRILVVAVALMAALAARGCGGRPVRACGPRRASIQMGPPFRRPAQ